MSFEPRKSPAVWLLIAVGVVAVDVVLGVALLQGGETQLLGMAIFLWVATLPLVVLAVVRSKQLRGPG